MNTEETGTIFSVHGKLLPHLYIFCIKSEENLEVYRDIFNYQDNYLANMGYPRKLFT